MIHNIGEPIMTLFKSIFSSAERFTGCMLAGVAAYLAPLSVVIICVVSFIIVDAILGYRVSRKYGRKKFESNKVWKTINKMFEATLLVVGANAIDAHIVQSIDLHAVEFISGMICGTEFLSWLESLKELHPNSKICKVIDKVLGDVIKAKGEKYLGVKIDIDDLKPKDNDNSNNISN